MLDRITGFADAPARALMAAIFILSGLGKARAFAATQSYMETFGLPGALLAPTIAFEIGAGFLLVVGLWTRQVALLLAGFSLLTALIFHRDLGDQLQMIMFLKNLAMIGGFLHIAKYGAPGLSLDRLRVARKGV